MRAAELKGNHTVRMYAFHIVLMDAHEWSVAHDIADAPFLLAVMVQRKTFFSEGASIVLFTL